MSLVVVPNEVLWLDPDAALGAGSIIFSVFRSRTSAYFFSQDLKHGGAGYMATGRGYALQHISFVSKYASYARSHLYYAFQVRDTPDISYEGATID